MKAPNFFHEIGDKVLFRGKPCKISDRIFLEENRRKMYRLNTMEGEPIIYNKQTWQREAYLMKYFDFDNR